MSPLLRLRPLLPFCDTLQQRLHEKKEELLLRKQDKVKSSYEVIVLKLKEPEEKIVLQGVRSWRLGCGGASYCFHLHFSEINFEIE